MKLREAFSKAVSKINLFAAFQAAAGGFLTLSGYLAGSVGRLETGIAVTARNALWVAANRFMHNVPGSGVKKEILQTRSNMAFSALAALSYVPEFWHGIVDPGHFINVDTLAGLTGVLGFTFMTVDKYAEQKKLSAFQAENPEVDELSEGLKDKVLEYDHASADVILNWLPSSLLVAKGAVFSLYAVNELTAACGQVSPTAAQVLGSASLLLCGGLFTWSAFKELQEENKSLLPKLSKKNDDKKPPKPSLPAPKV